MPETNFLPDPSSPWIPPAVYYGDLNANGSGVPNGVVFGWPGATYLDVSSGDRWTKASGEGTTDGWTLDVAGGGGGAGLTYSQGAALDPNGSIVGSIGDVYHSRLGLGGDGSTWWKVSGIATNTGWE